MKGLVFVLLVLKVQFIEANSLRNAPENSVVPLLTPEENIGKELLEKENKNLDFLKTNVINVEQKETTTTVLKKQYQVATERKNNTNYLMHNVNQTNNLNYKAQAITNKNDKNIQENELLKNNFAITKNNKNDIAINNDKPKFDWSKNNNAIKKNNNAEINKSKLKFDLLKNEVYLNNNVLQFAPKNTYQKLDSQFYKSRHPFTNLNKLNLNYQWHKQPFTYNKNLNDYSWRWPKQFSKHDASFEDNNYINKSSTKVNKWKFADFLKTYFNIDLGAWKTTMKKIRNVLGLNQFWSNFEKSKEFIRAKYGSRSVFPDKKDILDYDSNDLDSWHSSSWKTLPWTYKQNNLPKKPYHVNYDNNLSLTGRLFVTMFGYPSRCEHSGNSHACTLSVACWLIGGISKAGCGGSSWLVSCCIKQKRGAEYKNALEDVEDHYQQLEIKEELQMQRRNDEVEECGLSADRMMLKRIIGGTIAKFAQFPWQAHLKIAAYQCGGVLVTRKFVSTAAHCIIRARLKDITVYLGELDTQDTGTVMEYAPAELHRVRRKIVHPNFQFRLTQPDRYDVALLELVTDAGFSYHIVPICLPDFGISLKGKKGVVAGWGKTKPSTELMGTNILRSATVPILGIEECMKWHENKEIVVELHEEMLCAGHEDGHQDACLGDSGGPLIVLQGGRWTLAGITSAGFGCGEPHQPGIYHSIPVTVDWIRSVVYS